MVAKADALIENYAPGVLEKLGVGPVHVIGSSTGGAITQVLALDHPNIAAIYGLEESAEVDYLVLELVEGDTLHGPLPLATALDRAGQVAEAIELEEQTLAAKRVQFPAGHPAILESVENLIACYELSGRGGDAQRLRSEFPAAALPAGGNSKN